MKNEFKVDKYPARPFEKAKADPAELAKIENRPKVDQIADYHEKNPTLNAKNLKAADIPSASNTVDPPAALQDPTPDDAPAGDKPDKK